MGTRNVRLDEGVYERVKAEKRNGETFSEAIERLIGSASLLELVGILSDDEAEAMRKAIEDADGDATVASTNPSLDSMTNDPRFDVRDRFDGGQRGSRRE